MTLDNGTDGQTDRQTDRQSATQYAAPPREEGRIKNAQRRCKHCALAVVRWTHKQINKQTHKQIYRKGRLQYTAQLSVQCNK